MSKTTYIKVSDVMTPSVRVINRTATVSEAIRVMRQCNVSSLVVERRDIADEFGVVTVNDIAQQVIAPDQAPGRVNVYEIMSKPVLTVAADMNIKYAVRLLVRFGPSRAIVVDQERKPVGIVTLRDMVLQHAPDEDEASA
ncbi:MAG TPA: CBS domain-containing protein [Rhodospirillales bacterium]|nr:CBS domain-containing protein [Rhodospirillales bacterium]